MACRIQIAGYPLVPSLDKRPRVGTRGYGADNAPPLHYIRIESAMNYASLVAFVGQNTLLSLAFAGLTVALIYTELARLFRGYKAWTPAQLTALINRDNALVIDLRAQSDFEKGHIVGSRNLSLSQFEPDNKLLAKAKEQPVALICAAGMASGGAARKLVKAGFTQVGVLDGGIAAWQQASLPLAKGRT